MFDPETLRTFIAVAETGSFSKAAERLCKTTATISYRIKLLEENTGVALIRRKDQLNHQRAWDILSDTYEDMKRLNLGGTDQFFHCMAFCRVSKLNDAGVSRSAKGLGYEKEIRDYGLNLFGMYGRKVKLSHSEMIEDNKKDLAVNDHGLTCPSTTDCSDRCSDYINPEHKKTIKALQDAGYLK